MAKRGTIQRTSKAVRAANASATSCKPRVPAPSIIADYSPVPSLPNVEFYIVCNGSECHITLADGFGPDRLDGEWGGEQCEGCGDVINESGVVVLSRNVVACRNCKARYDIKREVR